ncbi:MAG: 6-phosphofructokinase [Solirubrobacterales bacterium]|nr:6-phosphofructokinase [Solirubrobacterales bacterium]
MKIGALTGGGDCPGLNAVIRAVVVRGASLGHEIVGYRDGWRGPLEDDRFDLTPDRVEGILATGGTILGSSRTNPLAEDGGIDRIGENMAAAGIDGLIAIGGEDTLGVARALTDVGIKVIGVPKTIDNDLGATDYTFGFDTAVNIAMEATDRLRTTGESHHRAMIVEVMGRHAGWIAFHTGMAAGADVILIPEREFDVDEVCRHVENRFAAGHAPIVVAAEGAMPIGGFPETADDSTDAFGHVRLGGVAAWLEREVKERTGRDARATVLGHIQRGGSPTAFDRVLATRCGLHAVAAASEGNWGTMAALKGTGIEMVTLAEAVDELKTVPSSLYAEAEVFFG